MSSIGGLKKKRLKMNCFEPSSFYFLTKTYLHPTSQLYHNFLILAII